MCQQSYKRTYDELLDVFQACLGDRYRPWEDAQRPPTIRGFRFGSWFAMEHDPNCAVVMNTNVAGRVYFVTGFADGVFEIVEATRQGRTTIMVRDVQSVVDFFDAGGEMHAGHYQPWPTPLPSYPPVG
jgi:hypothetical protein